MQQNRLAGETSPYLLQHQHNPVDWHPWGPEALALAKQTGKPILLSVGYAACHWCHVMAHESFENEAIASVMNEHFINIKVDREERPDLDAIYQNALAVLGEHGGWPLTMFLTPAAEPFWGGTYFPPEPRYGRAGFPQILQAVSAAYVNDTDRITTNVQAIGQALERLANPAPGGAISDAEQQQMAHRLLREMDPVNGGLGRAPKFPQPTALTLLWRQWQRNGDTACRDAALLTLTRMSQGGIYDHLGGGYARYSVDERWLAPHFEKMLYDNAQLLDLLTLAHLETGSPLFAQRREETVSWLLREMIAEDADGQPTGAFAATLDADSEGEEGRFYVWQESQIDDLLEPDDAAFFKRVYDVGATGNWEGKNILNRLHSTDWLGQEEEDRLLAMRQKLRQARDQRIWPGWDDKVLSDWNGLMIAALARSGFAAQRQDWLDAARKAFEFIATTLDENGRLFHSWRRGVRKHKGTLDDHANMIDAALALYQIDSDPRYMDQAITWVASVEAHFRDNAKGGFFTTAADADDLIVRAKNAHDTATPSGNGVMVRNYAQLFHLTGKDAYRQAAATCISAFTGELERNFFALCSLINGSDLLNHAIQVVVVGSPDAPATKALMEIVRRSGDSDIVLQQISPGFNLPPEHPAAGKGPSDDRPLAFVCRNQTCSLPMHDPAALESALGD